MARNASAARLKQRFSRIPKAVQANVTREIERQAGNIVVAMRIKAPHDTGALRKSIGFRLGNMRATILAGGQETLRHSKASATRSFVYSVRGSLGGKRGNSTGSYDYAFAVEFGTQKMSARPFFYPTWRKVRGRAGKAVRTAIKRGLA